MRGVVGLVAALLVSSSGARADRWLVLEAPAAVALSQVQQGVFRPGMMPALGGYVGNSWGAFGLRLRAGGLLNGPAPQGNLQDPGAGGLVTGALALRLTWWRGWAEVAGGGGLTGSDRVPVLEAGLGWEFPIAGLHVGPSARYLQVRSTDGTMDTFGTAQLVLVGIEVRFGQRGARTARRAEAAVRTRPRAPGPPPDAIDRDGDVAVDREQSCVQQLDDCRPLEGVTVEDDRLILEEHVLFERSRARVRTQGRLVIAHIARLWREHPDWLRIRIEGHTCDLGSEQLNHELSELRAERARGVLLGQGMDEQRVEAIGFGSSRPRRRGSDEAGRRYNRRVEFVVERAPRGVTSVGAAASPRVSEVDRAEASAPGAPGVSP
jgi:outer membrane protein OmpA-like peptidoglycan-associated protein